MTSNASTLPYTPPVSPVRTDDGRKPYDPPAIKHELALETRAGSPLGMLNPFDPRPKI